MSINGQPLDGLSHTDAVNLLKNAFGRIILQVLRSMESQLGEADKWRQERQQSVTGSRHRHPAGGLLMGIMKVESEKLLFLFRNSLMPPIQA